MLCSSRFSIDIFFWEKKPCISAAIRPTGNQNTRSYLVQLAIITNAHISSHRKSKGNISIYWLVFKKQRKEKKQTCNLVKIVLSVLTSENDVLGHLYRNSLQIDLLLYLFHPCQRVWPKISIQKQVSVTSQRTSESLCWRRQSGFQPPLFKALWKKQNQRLKDAWECCRVRVWFRWEVSWADSRHSCKLAAWLAAW